MVAKAKFTPVGTDEIDLSVVWGQAVKALDVAGTLAQQHNDVDGLLKVAALYIEFGNAMIVDGEEEAVDQEALDRKIPLGFSPCPVVIPVEEVELEDERIDEQAPESQG